MKHLRIMAFLIYTFQVSLTAAGQSDSIFKPHGKPVFLLFTNVHSSFTRNVINPAFEITRLYLGYEHFFSESLSARANIDVADPGTGGLQMTAYVKNAFVQYSNGKFSGRLGMIGTDQFSLIEKQWGYRYIFKTLQDEYSFGPSADLGVAAEYSPAEFISFDASVLNGEGFKRIQSDSIFKYTFGITLRPFKGLQFRGYTDIMKRDFAQKTISLFAGYTYEDIKVGFEFSTQQNSRMMANHDFSGISAFASVKLSEKFSALARYDYLWSAFIITGSDPWNLDKDGQMVMAGIEYSPVKGIRIAPVFIGWLPSDDSQPYRSTPGLHLEIRY